ncbi:CheR family methyltransferase [Methylobacterium organophilum]|uniref:Chemotaxis protein methyltransferase n=1 Tax=Methylobacterium organophilum TaxID=410 RepID=A0ABQ4T7S5_METOR|nr:protein-glutamate O-methyltransferase CheR [Methylobacterium organophilum]UMY16736.1 protein-glutamate O-methyltransferase CheR [Methylobacterium organophilum]GJE27663.1 Chemotaxis protein methyltransferase Cher2 [Methylobacterium organophilum]
MSALPAAHNPDVSESDFTRFRDFFYRKTGIMFGDNKRYFVDKRLQERMLATGQVAFRDYFNTLRFQASGAEFQALVNLMTVNETYFYREEYQFHCLIRSILPEVVRAKRPGAPVRIWSVPCSTGEEPYSIAFQLLDNWAEVDRYDIEIVASDIDTTVIEQARRGLYGERAVQHVPKATLDRFTRRVRGAYEVLPDIRDSIAFHQVNLSDPLSTRQFRGFDVVFCRNLLIYFDDASRRDAAQTIFEALRPGGFVCLGHSESMSRISSLFAIRKFAEAIVYQKPFDAEA